MDYYAEVTETLEKVKSGKPIIQRAYGDRYTMLGYLDFTGWYFETYQSIDDRLIGVELIDEATARFSLT